MPSPSGQGPVRRDRVREPMTEPNTLPSGFLAAGAACGLKDGTKLDLGLIVADEGFPAYAIYTQNNLLGAHIPVCYRHLRSSRGLVRAVLVNSGNANCAMGSDGEKDNESVCAALARLIGCPREQVLFLSTGVIGERLQVEKIVAALLDLVGAVREDGIDSFAEAIMTTDTVAKVATGTVTATEGETVHITGVAKGSGMIHPDMATMLAFLLTDGRSIADLQMGLSALADWSFHRVTVDGDTSPNDTVLLWTANRHWCRPEKDEHGIEVLPLENELRRVSEVLSRKIAADGEGATRLVTIQVRGAMGDADTLDAGRFIATSPLVKTAVFGCDPNWGRILSAAATSGITIDVAKAKVWIGEHELFSDGTPHPENEAAARDYMEQSKEVVLGIDLGMGPFDGDVWTCDLSDEYVRINADYRT